MATAIRAASTGERLTTDHSEWCYYSGNQEAFEFPWPWPGASPTFWRGEVYGFTGGFGDDSSPEAWRYDGTGIGDGSGIHVPREGAIGAPARELIKKANTLWGFHEAWLRTHGKESEWPTTVD